MTGKSVPDGQKGWAHVRSDGDDRGISVVLAGGGTAGHVEPAMAV